ncbi:MAG: ABC transporter permease, partial [Candidatus Paceibacteria bacterium]
TFLGGVFYSLEEIPDGWATLSHFNPILYMVNGFRYGFLGYSDVSVWACFSVLFALLIVVFFGVWLIFRTGYGLKE